MSGAALARLGALCAAWRGAHEALATAAAEVREAQRAAARARAAELQRLALAAEEAREAVLEAVSEERALFARPKTRVIEGVKVGLRKQPGSIHIADAEETVAAVWQHMPERAAALIRMTEAPVKAALRALPAEELAAIGVVIDDDEDAAVAKIAGADEGGDEIAALLADAEGGGA